MLSIILCLGKPSSAQASDQHKMRIPLSWLVNASRAEQLARSGLSSSELARRSCLLLSVPQPHPVQTEHKSCPTALPTVLTHITHSQAIVTLRLRDLICTEIAPAYGICGSIAAGKW